MDVPGRPLNSCCNQYLSSRLPRTSNEALQKSGRRLYRWPQMFGRHRAVSERLTYLDGAALAERRPVFSTAANVIRDHPTVNSKTQQDSPLELHIRERFAGKHSTTHPSPSKGISRIEVP
jgi:hypothetical protein